MELVQVLVGEIVVEVVVRVAAAVEVVHGHGIRMIRHQNRS